MARISWTSDMVERLLACDTVAKRRVAVADATSPFYGMSPNYLSNQYFKFSRRAIGLVELAVPAEVEIEVADEGVVDELEQSRTQVVDLRRALTNTQRQLAKQREKTELLVAATMEGAHAAMLALGPVRPVPVPRYTNGGKARPEVALWHLTDWQGAKRTPSYNSEVMRQRVMNYVDRAEEITRIQRAHHPVNECFILLGGDMIEGLFNFPGQVFEIDSTLFTQFVTVSRLIVDVVRRALAFYQRVTVVAEWGNHGRIGSKRDNVPRADNFDRMCYELARQLLAEEKRLMWEDCPEDVQRVEIGAYRALLIHGDEVGRSGFASPMTLVRHADRWASGAYRVDGRPWAFRDVYIGHYHTHAEWPMANGEGSIYQTGSTESDNRYARDTMAASAQPSQRLHFIDPLKGRVTSQFKVWVESDPVPAAVRQLRSRREAA